MAKKTAKTIEKDIKDCDRYIMEYIREGLMEEFVPILKEMILADYDVELVGRVTDRKSRTNPLFYRDEFEEAMDDYEWLEEGTNYTLLHVPDITTFPWQQGRLRVIENILDGTIGTYVEVDEQQYINMYDKTPRAVTVYDKTVPRKERIYLLRYTPAVQRLELQTFGRKQLVRYPFSNIPPIPLFEPTITYAEQNGGEWVQAATKKAIKEYYR